MILFYSEYCTHCSMLLEHIKRYDNDNMIKLVSIDTLRSRNIQICSKIHSVPALVLLPSKEIIYGKSAFDHLLLPPRGILCGGSTRNDKNNKKENTMNVPDSSINQPTNDIGGKENEPSAFSLNCCSVLSDNYSNIDDTIDTIIDKNYKWDTIVSGQEIVAYQKDITDTNTKTDVENKRTEPVINKKEEKTKGVLPSLEELQKQRDSEVFFK